MSAGTSSPFLSSERSGVDHTQSPVKKEGRKEGRKEEEEEEGGGKKKEMSQGRGKFFFKNF